MAKGLFNTGHNDRVNSPEQLNDYIKIARPGIWLTLIAILILLFSIFTWCIFGSLESSVTVSGIADGKIAACFVSDTSSISVGNEVAVGDIKGTVVSVSTDPVKKEQLLSDITADEYDIYRLQLDEWNYIVEISLESEVSDGYVTANIKTEAVSPITFIWG